MHIQQWAPPKFDYITIRQILYEMMQMMNAILAAVTVQIAIIMLVTASFIVWKIAMWIRTTMTRSPDGTEATVGSAPPAAATATPEEPPAATATPEEPPTVEPPPVPPPAPPPVAAPSPKATPAPPVVAPAKAPPPVAKATAQAQPQFTPKAKARRVTPEVSVYQMCRCVDQNHAVVVNRNEYSVFATCMNCRHHVTWRLRAQPTFNIHEGLRRRVEPVWNALQRAR